MATGMAVQVDEASAQQAELAELRQELDSLRVMQLQKRALAAGVEEGAVEDAMDSGQPKAALVELVLTKAAV